MLELKNFMPINYLKKEKFTYGTVITISTNKPSF